MSSGVEFDEDKFGAANRAYSSARSESKMTNWLMKHGLAKSAGSAQTIMIVFIIINLIIAYILIKKFI